MILKYIQNSDLFLLNIFNHRIKCRILDKIMPVVTYIGSVGFAVAYCLGTLMFNNKNIHSLGIKASLSLSLATIISQSIKTSVSRIRPFIRVDNLNIKKIGVDKYSFPSGHTNAAFSLAVTTAMIFPALSFVCFALASMVGISRMYLGVHYPSDVIAGIILGSSSSMLIHFLF